MRRTPRLGLIGVAILIVGAVGLYTAYWLIAAERLKDGAALWAQSARAQGLAVSWRSISVGGYPFSFAVRLEEPRLRDEAMTPLAELVAPVLRASARPWDLNLWRMAARQGLVATLGGAGQTLARATADAATGGVSVAPDGAVTIWLALDRMSTEAASVPGGRAAVDTAYGWLLLPARPPQSHSERYLGFGADLYQIRVPGAPTPFDRTIDNLTIVLTVNGMIPGGPLRQSAQAWRQSGGAIELDNFRLFWDALAITGTGTVALDRELQPTAAFSAVIAGYDSLLTALVGAGKVRPSDAGLAKVALAMRAKPGPDGRLSISTSFTIENGEMYLGPVKLGKAPRIPWP